MITKPKPQKYFATPLKAKDNYQALYGIMLFTCLVSFWGWQNLTSTSQQFAYSFYDVVKRGEWYRLFTYGFLHGNKMHLISNMFYLLVAGSWLCRNTAMSNTKFFVCYISSLVFSLLFAICSIHKNLFNLGIKLGGIGSSGAVVAVIFASLLLSPNKSATYTLVPLAYFFYRDYIKLADVALQDVAAVHLGGALYGLVYVIIFYPRQLLTIKCHPHNRR